uniref:Uncharacterized protein n=1 Tax=Plectus sambesii TaxID=2011161 RepID=A0A914UJH3_9BILA
MVERRSLVDRDGENDGQRRHLCGCPLRARIGNSSILHVATWRATGWSAVVCSGQHWSAAATTPPQTLPQFSRTIVRLREWVVVVVAAAAECFSCGRVFQFGRGARKGRTVDAADNSSRWAGRTHV